MTSSHSPSLLQRWTTLDEQQPLLRRDSYAEVLENAVTPMRVQVPDVEDFHADFVSVDFGPLSLLRMTGAAHTVARGSREMERGSAHTFHLMANIAGNMRATQRGQAMLRASDAILMDSQTPFQLDVPSYDVVHVRMSEAWVRTWLPTPRVALGRVILRDAGWSRALCAFMMQLSPQVIVDTPLPLTVVADQIGALLSLAVNEMTALPVTSTRPERGLSERIQECIVERCAESSLTAADVAQALNVSTRTLHRSLGAANQTFGASLMAARVDLAGRMLRSPLFKRLTTAEIGRRAGFVNASHFARVVHKRCGLSPSEIRTKQQ